MPIYINAEKPIEQIERLIRLYNHGAPTEETDPVRYGIVQGLKAALGYIGTSPIIDIVAVERKETNHE